MDFNQKKLPKDVVEHLRACPISTVKPYALMMAPVYVYMKLNEKFVMLKRALDFFTEEELERLKAFDTLFFPAEVEIAIEFRKVASDVRELLSWDPENATVHLLKEKKGKQAAGKSEIPLMPTSYELSDAVIRHIGALWRPGPSIDPFYVAVFANELCELLPGETLKAYRDQSIVEYEKAVICSSWAVFLALHLGYTDLAFLNRLRRRLMHEVMAGQINSGASSEINELARAARDSLGEELTSVPGKTIAFRALNERFGVTSEKFSSRMRRVERLVHV